MDDINIQLALNEDTSAKILAEFDRLDERFEVMEGELRTASASAGQVISVLKGESLPPGFKKILTFDRAYILPHSKSAQCC
jgi:hypothetical protein